MEERLRIPHDTRAIATIVSIVILAVGLMSLVAFELSRAYWAD